MTLQLCNAAFNQYDYLLMIIQYKIMSFYLQVMPNMVYAGTLSLVRNILSRFGVEFTSVDGTDPEKYREAVKPSTKVSTGIFHLL